MTDPLTREVLKEKLLDLRRPDPTELEHGKTVEVFTDDLLQLIDTYTQQQWETQEAIRKDQLARAEKIVQAKVLEARAEELGAAYAGLMNEPEHRLVVVIHQMKDRLADLQKQLEGGEMSANNFYFAYQIGNKWYGWDAMAGSVGRPQRR